MPILIGHSAMAQVQPVLADEIVVTGSRLETAASDSPAPVSVIDPADLTVTTGSISIGDQLAELPQFSPSSTRAASVSPTGGNSSTGLNLLDLRGIGASRTLVLQNGRRHVSSSQDTAQPDVNTIPAALLERVEVLTGGASSVYGADAIAGVVNFVLRDDFEGLEVAGRGGVSDEGDAETFTFSLTGGRNFDGGRGNVAANFEYSTSEILRYSERDFAARETTIQIPNPADTDVPGGAPDGIPDFITVNDLRRANISNGGTINTAGGLLQFDDQGNLVPVDIGGGILPGFVTDGGSGLNGIESETLLPSLDRVAFNVLADYDLDNGSRLFFEGKFVQTDTTVFSSAPFSNLPVFLDNPFLTDQARATLSATTPSPFGPPIFLSGRVSRDIGDRGLDLRRQTFRAVVGVEGTFADRFDYEVFYNFGQTDTRTDYLGNAILPRIGLSADATVDGSGNPICRATLQTGGATGNPDIDN
ncbi:MAG: TonB-dependent receptor plug domain-containing protein, partial [Pseudomonadota bacterium]